MLYCFKSSFLLRSNKPTGPKMRVNFFSSHTIILNLFFIVDSRKSPIWSKKICTYYIIGYWITNFIIFYSLELATQRPETHWKKSIYQNLSPEDKLKWKWLDVEIGALQSLYHRPKRSDSKNYVAKKNWSALRIRKILCPSFKKSFPTLSSISYFIS